MKTTVDMMSRRPTSTISGSLRSQRSRGMRPRLLEDAVARLAQRLQDEVDEVRLGFAGLDESVPDRLGRLAPLAELLVGRGVDLNALFLEVLARRVVGLLGVLALPVGGLAAGRG